MTLVLANAYKPDLLTQKISLMNGWYLHLFQNNHTPSGDDDVSAYTEATFTGYAAQPMSAWGTPYLNSDLNGESDHHPLTFTQTATTVTNSIYGYYVTDGGELVLAERNPSAPVAMDTTAKEYVVIGEFIEGNLA